MNSTGMRWGQECQQGDWRDGSVVKKLATLPENPGSIPSIHMAAHNCNSSSMEPNTHSKIPTHTKKKSQNNAKHALYFGAFQIFRLWVFNCIPKSKTFQDLSTWNEAYPTPAELSKIPTFRWGDAGCSLSYSKGWGKGCLHAGAQRMRSSSQ